MDFPPAVVKLKIRAKPLICRKCHKPMTHKGRYGYIHPECRKFEDHTRQQRRDRWRASKGVLSKRVLLTTILEKLDCLNPDVAGVIALTRKLLDADNPMTLSNSKLDSHGNSG